MNNIQSGKVLIKEAFSWWYRVPEYQRPYVWGLDQVNDLLQDITDALETREDTEYFLGSVVMQKRQRSDDSGRSYEENDLLDGQQRLTTCLMLHAVARDLSTNPQLKKTCAAAIYQEANQFDGIPERSRIIFDIRDEVRDFINSAIKTSGGTLNDDLLKAGCKSQDVSVRNMAQAILEIRSFFQSGTGPSLDNFFVFFRNQVLLIYVASTHLEDAFRLFTVLNDRGLKLRNSDILKTKNLDALRQSGASAADVRQAAQLWEELEGELNEEFDTFLAHLRTILVKEKARLNLLQEFEDNIYQPKKFEKDTKVYISQKPLLAPGRETFDFVRRYRDHHLQLLSGNNHHLGRSWAFDNLITLLRDTGLADFWLPPLLHYREVYGELRIVEFAVRLENKFSGDWVARETPTFRIEAMNTVVKQIDELRRQEPTISKDAQVQALLDSNVFDFNKDEFFKQLDLSAIYGRRFTRYILYKLDMIYGGVGNRLQPPAEISVEHLLPQNPKEDSQWCKDFSVTDREVWTDRLGNLVLMSGRKNTQQGRIDYSAKKERYFQNHIESFPNSLRVLTKNKVWTPSELQANHEYVLQTLREYCA